MYRKIYNWNVRKVDKLAPLENSKPNANLVILSMVSHNDIYMYLMAIRSFYRYIGFGRVFVVNDGSLTEKDMDLLKKHIPFIEIQHISTIDTRVCPTGGCWERLIKIAELVEDNYVIQLDADSLVINEIGEILNCVSESRSFILSKNYTVDGKQLGYKKFFAKEFASYIEKDSPDYVESFVESSFKYFGDSDYYIKASACFAGFAQGSFSLDRLMDFSQKMQEFVGIDMWRKWGTEQVASNFMLSNAPDVLILPYPKYCSVYFNPEIDYLKSSYLHFTGFVRFKHGFYYKVSRFVLERMLNAGVSV